MAVYTLRKNFVVSLPLDPLVREARKAFDHQGITAIQATKRGSRFILIGGKDAYPFAVLQIGKANAFEEESGGREIHELHPQVTVHEHRFNNRDVLPTLEKVLESCEDDMHVINVNAPLVHPLRMQEELRHVIDQDVHVQVRNRENPSKAALHITQGKFAGHPHETPLAVVPLEHEASKHVDDTHVVCRRWGVVHKDRVRGAKRTVDTAEAITHALQHGPHHFVSLPAPAHTTLNLLQRQLDRSFNGIPVRVDLRGGMVNEAWLRRITIEAENDEPFARELLAYIPIAKAEERSDISARNALLVTEPHAYVVESAPARKIIGAEDCKAKVLDALKFFQH